MIDPSTRLKLLRELADDSSAAVVLLDVVPGYVLMMYPAGQVGPLCW